MTNQKPKIFLSYAHEDIGMAKRIYQDLKRYGLDIWLDTESLEVGQLWENAILGAIEESDYFIAVLSSNSMTKKGYVQKELKTALNVIDLLPEDKTYIMPVRIDDCIVKNRQLKRHHWIDVFPENEYQNGLKKILQVVSPGTVLLRSKEMRLSDIDVNDMIRKHDFFDRYKNPLGIGFLHKYKEMTIKGNKVIFDEIPCLMWQQSGSFKKMGINNADWYIDELNEMKFVGFSNWRLPTLEEAMSLLVEDPERKFGPYIDPIFDSKQRWIWTSDLALDESWEWLVDFSTGNCDWNSVELDYYVRAVRSAQPSDI
jgi:hypothetical protein